MARQDAKPPDRDDTGKLHPASMRLLKSIPSYISMPRAGHIISELLGAATLVLNKIQDDFPEIDNLDLSMSVLSYSKDNNLQRAALQTFLTTKSTVGFEKIADNITAAVTHIRCPWLPEGYQILVGIVPESYDVDTDKAFYRSVIFDSVEQMLKTGQPIQPDVFVQLCKEVKGVRTIQAGIGEA